MRNRIEMPEIKFEPNQYPLEPGLRLIEASAGTGKTFALAHLVLRLVTESGHNIKELLIVTFTEAAASELKSRITNRLEEALMGLENQEHDQDEIARDMVLHQWLKENCKSQSKRNVLANQLLMALEGIDHADITTIHGFCRRTLKRDIFETDSIINPKIEAEENQIHLEVVHEYWKNQILTLRAEHIRGLQKAGLTIASLTKALLKIDSNPSLRLKINKDLVDDKKALLEQFNKWIKDYWEKFDFYWQKDGKSLETELRIMAKFYKSQGAKDIKPFSSKPLKDRHQILNEWVENIRSKFNHNLIKYSPSYEEIRNQSLLESYFHPATLCIVANRCGDKNPSLLKPNLQHAIAELFDSPAENTWNHALKWTLDALSERRQKNGLLSFGGLLRALDPGENNTNKSNSNSNSISQITIRLRKRYKVALIDEFQDTDPSQWRLMKETFGNSSEHLMLMVGDPKQAIYRFRGGDLNTYMKAREEVDRIDILLDNFRATVPLMHGLNKLMAAGLTRSGLKVPELTPKNIKSELIPNGEHPLRVLIAGKNIKEDSNQTTPLESKTKLEEDIPTAIANVVLDLLLDEQRDIEPSDICILVNKHEQASSIRKELSNANIPTRLVSQGDVFHSEASLILQRFLDCLAKPGDSAKLRLVASSALIQWNPEKLTKAELSGELDELAVKFKQWAKNLQVQGLSGCLAELLEAKTMADLSERGRMLGDLQQCAQLVQEAIHMQGLNAITAANWLRRQRLQPIETIPQDRQPYSDIAASSVNVVTVHRSKGLEYRVVICPYLWQSPPEPKGPLWQVKDSPYWLISINNGWGRGMFAANEAKEAALQEAERIAYVALTRARTQLILVWAKGAKQEGSPIKSLLFGPDSLEESNEQLSITRMMNWLKDNAVPITINNALQKKPTLRWESPRLQGKISLGPVPKQQLDTSWGRNSYSTWILNSHPNSSYTTFEPVLFEEGKDRIHNDKELSQPIQEQGDAPRRNSSETNLPWPDQGPLGNFPRGAIAGDCLHRILEQLDFCESLQGANTTRIIEVELSKSGINLDQLESVQNGLGRVLNLPLGDPLGGLKLNQLHDKRRISELSFDIPIAQQGKALRTLDIANIFKHDPSHRFGLLYAEQLKALNIFSRGFLTGSIDLIFTDKEDSSKARWWVVDWKSNWIGKRNKQGEVLECGPIHYNNEAIEEQMLTHHYPLQAHIYLVALHRFLSWRLPNYSPPRHLGGYIYIFLRGIPKLENEDALGEIPGLLIEKAPLDRILNLNQLFEEGRK